MDDTTADSDKKPPTITEEELGRIKGMNSLYSVLSRINGFIIRVSDVNDLFESVCPIIVDEGGFKFAWIGLLDREAMEVRPVALWGDGEAYLNDIRLSTLQGQQYYTDPTVSAIRERRTVARNDIEHDVAAGVWKSRALAFGFRACAALPISIDDEVIGAITLYAGAPFTFGKDEMRVLDEVGGDISFALSNIGKLQKARYTLIFDPLTSLLTREHLLQEFQRLIDGSAVSGGRLAMVVMDIDKFKGVNDLLGYTKGDMLLKGIAQRLSSVIKAPNLLGRISADEFAIIGTGIKDEDSIYRIAEGVNVAFSRPVVIGGQDVSITFSTGISIYPDDGGNAEELLKLAEASLARAKKTGENSLIIYSPAVNQRLSEIAKMKSRIVKAFENGEFLIYYEPKINLKDSTLVGAEALLRWKDPEEGLIKPARFIPILEETGMILNVGQWVLGEASRQTKLWRGKGHTLRVAVNVSAEQLEHEDFADNVIAAIKDAGIRPSDVELEITEGLLMKNIEKNIEKILQVRDYGIPVSIDDFGTGYSSLSYLKKLPVTALKIDISFIENVPRDRENAKITETIISLAGVFRLKTIAEGVAKKEQADFLRDAGCDEAQGYYFTRPLPAGEFERFMDGFYQKHPVKGVGQR
ncbi:MAG: EAL domain-containing protein [Deltaproteobacteria bacterium]|nr:EAL domain-containing protein [Deltaproteobacteria bacterium]